MTTEQAAAMLGVSERRVRQLSLAGALHAQKVGRDWLIQRSEIERWKRERADANRGKRGRPFKT